MNRAASVPNGMRNDEAKQRASRIEKPCRAWILYWMRGVLEMTCPRGRKGMLEWDDADSMPAMRYATRR